jgi:hypothetical protein
MFRNCVNHAQICAEGRKLFNNVYAENPERYRYIFTMPPRKQQQPSTSTEEVVPHNNAQKTLIPFLAKGETPSSDVLKKKKKVSIAETGLHGRVAAVERMLEHLKDVMDARWYQEEANTQLTGTQDVDTEEDYEDEGIDDVSSDDEEVIVPPPKKRRVIKE